MRHESTCSSQPALVTETVDMIEGAINPHPEASGCRLIATKPFGSYALNMGCL